MWVENKSAEAKAMLDIRAQMVDVDWMLLSGNSPISTDEDRVREIALAMHVAKADDKDNYTFPEVKAALIRAIEHGEMTNNPIVNIAAFKEFTDMSNKVRRRALIQRAVDGQLLQFDGNQFKALLNIDGEWRELARIDVREWEKKEDVLVAVLVKDMEKQLTFNQVVRVDFMGGTVDTAADVRKLTYGELKSKCQIAGIPVVGAGRTKEVLEKEYIEHLGLV